jgi:hypothetical protein
MIRLLGPRMIPRSLRSENGVTHWKEGVQTWELGTGGFFLRLRGIVGAMLINVPLMGVPFWWPEKNIEYLNISLTYLIVSTGVLFMSVLGGGLLYLKHRTIRSLHLKAKLHRIAHEMRDSLSKTNTLTQPKKGKRGSAELILLKEHLLSDSKTLANLLEGYFEKLSGDRSVGCAIRIGFDNPRDNKKFVEFVTVGRSDRLNANRGTTSAPIPETEGIPKFFKSAENASQGVLFYTSVEKAISKGLYIQTKNDSLYTDDFSSMVAVPLNSTCLSVLV